MSSTTLEQGPGNAEPTAKRDDWLPHPAFADVLAARASSWQLRLADRITAFAGAMIFVWIHAVLFGLWIATSGLGLTHDPFPFNFLTMVVSLEAIFLSTFVMISQNRADARRQVFADNQYEMIQDEKKQNLELLEQGKRIEALTQSVLSLTQEVHAKIATH